MNKEKWIYLSHYYNNSTPGYGGKKDFQQQEERCLLKGDKCNQLKFSMSNHVGTHIDLPFHFSATGKKMQDYNSGDWFFRKVDLVEIVLSKNDLIHPHHLKALSPDIDCLLLRTKFESFRDSEEYWAENPGLTKDLADYLKKTYKNLKVIGLDIISATAQKHKDEGRLAHYAFLGSENGDPILIIEDMKLSNIGDNEKIKVLHVAPLLIESADGAPVTVSALIE